MLLQYLLYCHSGTQSNTVDSKILQDSDRISFSNVWKLSLNVFQILMGAFIHTFAAKEWFWIWSRTILVGPSPDKRFLPRCIYQNLAPGPVQNHMMLHLLLVLACLVEPGTLMFVSPCDQPCRCDGSGIYGLSNKCRLGGLFYFNNFKVSTHTPVRTFK